MTKRGIRHFPPPKRPTLTDAQVARLMTPLHMAIELLPLGLFTREHAHDLAAMLTIAQYAAEASNRDDIIEHGASAALVLLAMRDRVEAGRNWNVTADEREALMRSVLAIDKWFPECPTVRWVQSIMRAYRVADAARARGMKPLEMIVEAA